MSAPSLPLASVDNLRDVAGDGYLTTDGARLRTGVLYRSNELQLTDADAATLAALGVAHVYDLREITEVETHPDVAVPGARWMHIPVEGIPMDEVVDLPHRQAALDAMHSVYRAFVEHPGARGAYTRLFTEIAAGSGAQLFHCTAGKDRTGWAAAVLLRWAGVPEDVVRADYLRTNDVGGTRAKYLPMIREHLGEKMVAVYEAVMVADLSYLDAADAALASKYGTLENYLTDGLGLDAATLVALRERLR